MGHPVCGNFLKRGGARRRATMRGRDAECAALRPRAHLCHALSHPPPAGLQERDNTSHVSSWDHRSVADRSSSVEESVGLTARFLAGIAQNLPSAQTPTRVSLIISHLRSIRLGTRVACRPVRPAPACCRRRSCFLSPPCPVVRGTRGWALFWAFPHAWLIAASDGWHLSHGGAVPAPWQPVGALYASWPRRSSDDRSGGRLPAWNTLGRTISEGGCVQRCGLVGSGRAEKGPKLETLTRRPAAPGGVVVQLAGGDSVALRKGLFPSTGSDRTIDPRHDGNRAQRSLGGPMEPFETRLGLARPFVGKRRRQTQSRTLYHPGKTLAAYRPAGLVSPQNRVDGLT